MAQRASNRVPAADAPHASGGLNILDSAWKHDFTTNCTESSRRHWWFRARRHIVWSLVRRYVDGGANRRLRVCELGCGTGGNLAAIADDHDVVGVECSPQALDYARQSLGDRVRFGSLPDDIDLPRSSFDVVLMTDVLEHIENDSGVCPHGTGTCASRRHCRRDSAGVPMAILAARCSASPFSPVRQKRNFAGCGIRTEHRLRC